MKEEFKMKRANDEEALMALMVDGVRPNGFTYSVLNAPSIKEEQEKTKEEPKKQKRVKKETKFIVCLNSLFCYGGIVRPAFYSFSR